MVLFLERNLVINLDWFLFDNSVIHYKTHLQWLDITLNFTCFVKNVDWQVQAMNDVSPLSPFPPQFASINFTTSQSGESYLTLIKWIGVIGDCVSVAKYSI